MNFLKFPILLFVAASLISCTETDEPSEPGVGDDGFGVPSGIYAVDQSHTYLTFSYLHQGLSYPLLRATGIDGELVLNTEAMENSSADISIDVASIRSNIDFFDKELASPKFFNSGKYPHITFATQAYESISDTEGALTGLVTIRGITKPLILTVKINGAMTNPMSGKPVIGFSASGYLNRSEFGLDRFIPAVADRVDVKIETEFALGSTDSSAEAASLARESAVSSEAVATNEEQP